MYLSRDLDRVADPILISGSEEQATGIISLKYGPVGLEYFEGSLRHFSVQGKEVLRRIYPTVRDDDWNTLIPVISDFRSDTGDASFRLRYTAMYRADKVNLEAVMEIEGNEKGQIRFSFKATSLGETLANRIGICILHPQTLMGTPTEILHSDGKKERSSFPKLVSPWPFFSDLKKMHWDPAEGINASLTFSGEVFETEDQRNWCDASFKTYAPPVAKPIPVLLKKGMSVNQEVIFDIHFTGSPSLDESPASHSTTITIYPENRNQLPAIGVLQSSTREKLSDNEFKKIKRLGLDHYRIDLHMADPLWESRFIQGNSEGKKMNLPLLVALYFNADAVAEVKLFIGKCFDIFPQIEEIMLFKEGSKATPHELFDQVEALLREGLHHARIGVGTHRHFADLNQNSPYPGKADFLVYQVNPQVHARDALTLIENLQAPGYAVKTLLHAESTRLVYASPVSLGSWNPAEIRTEDPRLHSLFGAGLVIGLVKSLAEAGVSSITLLETSGEFGILAGDPETPDSVQLFPVFLVLSRLLESKGFVLRSESSEPLRVNALVCKSASRVKIFLMNHTGEIQTVRLAGMTGQAVVRTLAPENIRQAVKDPETFFSSQGETLWMDENTSFSLDRYTILTMDLTEQATM